MMNLFANYSMVFFFLWGCMCMCVGVYVRSQDIFQLLSIVLSLSPYTMSPWSFNTGTLHMEFRPCILQKSLDCYGGKIEGVDHWCTAYHLIHHASQRNAKNGCYTSLQGHPHVKTKTTLDLNSHTYNYEEINFWLLYSPITYFQVFFTCSWDWQAEPWEIV